MKRPRIFLFFGVLVFFAFISGLHAAEPETAAILAEDQAALARPRPAPVWWLPESLSTVSGKVDRLFYGLLFLTGGVFFGVQGLLLFFMFRYRRDRHPQAAPVRGNTRVEVVWTVIPALLLAAAALVSQGVRRELRAGMPGAGEAEVIRVQAEQYAWNVQYPGADGRFDTADDIRLINQMHIPAHRKVRVTLTSTGRDGQPAVVHSFFIPEFRLKQDVVPGMAIDVWFEAVKTGRYEIACAEFCGLGHYRMRGFLFIHTPPGYDAWKRGKESGA